MRRLKKTIAAAVFGLFVGTVASQAQTQILHPTTTSWKYLADNTDQGVAWVGTAFDDSTWPSGTGLFGTDAGYPYAFATAIPAPNGGGPTACYFRTKFNWSGGTAGVVLTGTNYIDDGSVIYLNGVEIARFNMVGAVTFSSVAPVANPGGFPNINGGEPVVVRLQIPLGSLTNGNANPLVTGQNTLAVEVHNNSTTSSDTVFGLALYGAQALIPCAAPIAPTSTNSVQCRNVTFTLNISENCGVPAPTIQWYKNVGGGEQEITGQTGMTLSLTNVQSGDAGQYYAKLTNPSGTAQSLAGTLTVTPDTQGPKILTVVGVAAPATDWIVTFDEPVLPFGGGDDYLTYIIQTKEAAGIEPQVLTVANAVIEPNNPSQVRLTTQEARVAGKSYTYETAQDIIDLCAGQVTAAGLKGDIYLDTVIYTATDLGLTWKYDDTAVDRGTAWKDIVYDDSGWKSGVGVFDAKDTPRTVVSGLTVGTQLNRRVVGTPFETVNLPTIYLRAHIAIPAGAKSVTIRTVADDGYALYVNGVEVSRLRAPAANDGFAAYAGGGTVGDANYEGPVTIPLANLNVGGDNVFAVLLKQNDGTSTDITWGLEVTAQVTGITVTAPQITLQPISALVTEGHSFTLISAASGTSPTYQWTKDGVDIPGANSSTYTAVAGPTTVGSYRMKASNIGGTATSDPAAITMRAVSVPYGHVWKYDITSQDATLSGGATPWYATGFNDTAWTSGPGPFGVETTAATMARLPAPIATALPAPSATFLTAYFRTTVTVPAVPAGQQLVLTHVVDDGAVFYVDGVLALRYNMPNPTPILAADLAPGTAPGDGDAMMVSVPITLPPGAHQIAAEVHQNSATSSDVVFGGELRLISGPAPTLTITHPTPTSVTVTWPTSAQYSLYQATVVTGPFLPVANNPQGSYTVANIAPDAARFFQVRFNGR